MNAAATTFAPEKVVDLPEGWTLVLWSDGTATLRNFEGGEGGTIPAETVTALRTALAKGDAA